MWRRQLGGLYISSLVRFGYGWINKALHLMSVGIWDNCVRWQGRNTKTQTIFSPFKQEHLSFFFLIVESKTSKTVNAWGIGTHFVNVFQSCLKIFSSSFLFDGVTALTPHQMCKGKDVTVRGTSYSGWSRGRITGKEMLPAVLSSVTPLKPALSLLVSRPFS